MNEQIRHLFVLVVVLFAALIAFTSRWTVFEADALKDNPNNRRALLEEIRIPRGEIRAADGTLLAGNRKVGSGKDTRYKRTYPERGLFAHALGYAFISRGSAGLERSLDDELAGRDDEFATLIDEIMGRRKEGRDIRTTLDPDGQRAALQALQGRKGAVVAIEPSTGRVRVMASAPGFDPTAVGERGSKAGDLFNRVTAARYPPGSTMKVVTAAAALDSKRYRPDSIVSGKSPKVISGAPLNNFGNQDYGPVSLTDALTNSVNTVWAEVGEKLGRKTMYEYMQRFGFQDKLPLDYPRDEMTASGLLRRGRVLRDAGIVDIGRVAIGQEQHLFVSPLQMATVAATVANGGDRMRPRLVERVAAKDGRVTRRVRPRREEEVISAEAAQQLTAMMSRVVEEGTGTAARLEGVSVAGKTGTAEIPGRTENQVWFIGFAPVGKPRMAIAVTLERTQGEGGTVAAPIAKQVLQALLGEGRVAEVAENTMVDARYRITGRIGTGGMADVYHAHDEHLGRDVALKILHRRFAQDAEFVERFRREASSAAGLQHPNVVNVYDRGEYDGTYYIAMELLRGRTLKDVLAADAPLDPDRAIDITVQLLAAAGFAHKRGIIHRDFKPQNVIADDDGRVKVTDFGIARAGASEITEAGSIMGTAQYLSPEQAQGQPVTQASDIYSIGVMLYEMLGGRLPFTGDSAVAIALRHLTEFPPELHEAHPALEAVVMQALEKDPSRRFQSAAAFVTALEHARAQLATEPLGQDTAVFGPLPVVEETYVHPEPLVYEEYPHERRWWPWVLLVLLLAALAIAAFALTRPEQRTVPQTVGREAPQARAVLEQAGFEADFEREESLQPPDRVIRTEPSGGTRADEGSTVTVVVSSGPPDAVVPPVDGLSEKQALRTLNKAGFKIDEPARESSETVKKGLVTRTSPAGGTVAQVGSRIRIYVSSGRPRARVPDVVGLSQSAAERALEDKELVADVERTASDEPEGDVVAQSIPEGREVPEGTRVTIQVSEGPQSAEVAGVIGLVEADARRQLQEDGFRVEVRDRAVSDEADDGVVVDQRPREGTELKKGRTIVVFVGRYEAPPEDFTPPEDQPPAEPAP